MLTNLYVKNMALIDEADIDFENGLTVLTGETGAGKSIILDSLAIALGLKNPGEMLRENAEPALAQVSFYFSDSDLSKKIRDILEEDLPDGDLIIQRKILSGRSQFKINGINVNAAQVREIGPLLLDLHAQRDNLRLLKEENQLELVDCFCSDELSKNKEILSGKYSDYIRIKKELASLGSDDREREREADLLSFEVNELESAALKPGEDEELEERFLKIQNLQKIKEGLSSALEHISYGNGNASDSIGEARRVLGNVESFDPELARINEVLGDAEGIINDCIRDMSSYADSSDSSDEEYYEISERLNIYNRLKSKFNTDTAGLLNVLDEKKKRLEIISDFDNAKVELEGQIKALEKEMTEICKKVTAEREKTAERLGKEIAEAAKDLKRRINKAKKRHAELETMIKALYESFLLGKIPEKRFEMLSEIVGIVNGFARGSEPGVAATVYAGFINPAIAAKASKFPSASAICSPIVSVVWTFPIIRKMHKARHNGGVGIEKRDTVEIRFA